MSIYGNILEARKWLISLWFFCVLKITNHMKLNSEVTTWLPNLFPEKDHMRKGWGRTWSGIRISLVPFHQFFWSCVQVWSRTLKTCLWWSNSRYIYQISHFCVLCSSAYVNYWMREDILRGKKASTAQNIFKSFSQNFRCWVISLCVLTSSVLFQAAFWIVESEDNQTQPS